MVEFALIIGVLFMIIFVVIEAGHLLQANLTVQNAARAAGRYAITGQFETGCLIEDPPCADPRVVSIQSVAEDALSGLSLDPDAGFEDPGFYLIEVFGADAQGNLLENSAGVPGRPIIVRVSYRAAILTPLLRPIAETVMVTGQTIMNNERVVQIGTAGESEAPPVPIPPPIEPTPAPPPALAIDKSAPSSVLEGAVFNYELTVQNNGDQAAANVEMSDLLDSRLTFNAVNDEMCTGGVTVICSWPSLAAGQEKVVQITVTVDEGTAGDIIPNLATVKSDDMDTSSADLSASVQTIILPDTDETDLEITKTGPANVPVSTDEHPYFIDYSVTVRNNGPKDAGNVEVTDTLPEGLLFSEDGSSEECSGGPTVVTCHLDSLANGAAKTLTIRARSPGSAAILVNAVTVSAAEPATDPDIANNTAYHETEFSEMADLEISKTASPSPAVAGETLTYNIEVWNNANSPHSATGVQIFDPLPSSVQLQSATYERADGSSGNCSVSGSVVTCPMGTLAPGASAHATIRVIPQEVGALSNSAQVAGRQYDPDTINSATVVTDVEARIDLSIIKEGPEEVSAGDLVEYTLSVTNNGPSRATGVRVEDQLPDELFFQFVETDHGACNEAWGRISCNLGAVHVGRLVTIRIVGIAIIATEPQSPILNTAEVSGNEPDDVQPNNSTAQTTITPGPPFIVLEPACGPAGAPVTIHGFQWSHKDNPGAGNLRYITLSMRQGDENATVIATENIDPRNINEDGSFVHDAWSIPEDAYKEIIRVRAEQPADNTGPNPAPAAAYTALFTVPCPAPDLEIDAISAAASDLEQFQELDFAVTIRNTGNRPINSPFYVSLYAFEEEVSDPDDFLSAENRLDVAIVNKLGEDGNIELTLSVPQGFAAAGEYYVYALADSVPAGGGQIAEMYEDNNFDYVVIDVAESDTEPPEEPLQGQSQLSGETFINTGGLDASVWTPQPFVRVSVYESAHGPWLATTYAGYPDAEYHVTSLPDLDSYYVEATITVDGVTYNYAGTVTSSPQSLILERQQ